MRAIFAAHVDRGARSARSRTTCYDRGIPSPTGKPIWGTSTLQRLLANEAYIGRVYYNRRETINGAPAHRGARRTKTRYRERPREEWITIPVPAIIDPDTFARAQQVRRENPKWSPRGDRARALAAARADRVRPLPGRLQLPQDARPQRHLPPLLLLPQPRHPARRRRTPALPRAQHPRRRARRLRLRPGPPRAARARPADRRRARRHHHHAARRRRADRRPAHRARAQARRRPSASAAGCSTPTKPSCSTSTNSPAAPPRSPPAATNSPPSTPNSPTAAPSSRRENRLRRGIAGFAERVLASLDELDFDGRQRLLRLVVEKVRVTGWRVEIHLKIPLPDDPPPEREPRPPKPDPGPSSDMGLRSVGGA